MMKAGAQRGVWGEGLCCQCRCAARVQVWPDQEAKPKSTALGLPVHCLWGLTTLREGVFEGSFGMEVVFTVSSLTFSFPDLRVR